MSHTAHLESVVSTPLFCLIAFSKLSPTWTCKSQTWLQPSSSHVDVSLLLWRQWHHDDVRQMKNFRRWKKQWGSDTLLWNTYPVWFSMLVLNWTEIVHCRRNITFWLEEEYLGLCVSCISSISAVGQDNFFLKPTVQGEQETASAGELTEHVESNSYWKYHLSLAVEES